MAQTKLREEQIVALGPSGFDAVWTYDTSTTMSDPGAGTIRSNHATGASVTQLAISTTTDGGLDATLYLGELEGGDIIAIQQFDDASKWIRYQVDSSPTNNTTWFLVPVVLHISSGSGAPAKNEDMFIQFVYASGIRPADADIKDVVGTMVTSNTETGITVTYDGDHLNFVTLARERLTAARTYYVRTDGSDSNTGLVNSSGGAFLTLQKAYDTILTIDLSGYDVTIQVGDGTYTAGLSITKSPVGGNVILNGNSGTPANVVINPAGDAIYAFTPITLTIQNLELRGSNSINVAGGGCHIIIGAGMRFGAVAGAHMRAVSLAIIDGSSNYSITGGAYFHYAALAGGQVGFQLCTVTITGTPAFTIFAIGNMLGTVASYSVTFSGAATGQRYEASAIGLVQTYGGGANYFPGNAAGATASGGQYL